MTAKEYLSQLEILHLKIEHKRKRSIELRELALSLGGSDYGKDCVKTLLKEGKLEKSVTQYIALEAEITEDIYEYNQKKDLIIGEIHSLDNAKYIKILYKKYVEFKSLDKIATEMKYSYQYIKHMHGAALKSFEEKIKMTPNNTF